MEQPSSVISPINCQSLPMRIVIADDHRLFNDGLQQLLSADADIVVVKQLFVGNQVVPAIQRLLPDIILLDINLPGKDGLAISRELKEICPSVRIVLLSMYNDRHFIREARKIGVAGYLLKTISGDKLKEALWQVLNGKSCYFIDDDPILNTPTDGFLSKHKLTQREIEIIGLVVQGKSSKEIARDLFVSVYTVETHRRNINVKLNVKKPAELVAKAIEIGF